jgi:hypothetical protein
MAPPWQAAAPPLQAHADTVLLPWDREEAPYATSMQATQLA